MVYRRTDTSQAQGSLRAVDALEGNNIIFTLTGNKEVFTLKAFCALRFIRESGYLTQLLKALMDV